MSVQQLRRKYRLNDIEMLAKAKACRLFFIEDKADFIAFSIIFSDPFAQNWLQAIKNAEQLVTDETRADIIQGSTYKVKQALQNMRKSYRNLEYFVNVAFPSNPAMQKVFQKDKFRSVRNSPLKAIVFLELVLAATNKYKNELLNAGYQQIKMAELLQIKNDLEAAYQEQQQLKKERKLHTQERNNAHNAVWDTYSTVCRAGKLIYMDNYAKYQRYLLNRKDS